MTRKRAQIAPGFPTSKIVLASIAIFALGYYMLNYVATWEDPPIGNTFHIIFGCIFMAVAAIALLVVLKITYFPKKKKKRGSKPVFLDGEQKRSSRRRPSE